jgi:hypothetical protein
MRNRVKDFLKRNESYISPITLLGGFVFDNLTLRRVDLWAENLVMIIYLSVATVAIFLINARESGWFGFGIFKKNVTYLVLLLQFVFGGLFSAFFIFYSRSASLAGSWPFLAVLVLIMIGNDKFRGRYLKAVFQISILYTAYFSYLVFAVPILLRQINSTVFIISGLFSLILAGLLALLFLLLLPKVFKNIKYSLALSIIIIYSVFNAFYYFNLIPPIPLALKESGIYHSVKRAGEDYKVEYEKVTWYDEAKLADTVFHWRKGEPVYCFSSVFAPTKISTRIYHRWFLYDESSRKWLEKDRLGFSISGGRDGGYRGYSLKYGVEAGYWKIDIENEQGQLLGRKKFEIIETSESIITDFKIIK